MSQEVTVEISMYPLQDNFIHIIQQFIDRLNTYSDIRVITNTLSTQVFGPYDTVMSAVTTEMKSAHHNAGQAIFVMKVLSGNLAPSSNG